MSMRVYEFAKLHDLVSKDVLIFLQKQGFECKSHMSIIAPEALILLEKKYVKNNLVEKKIEKKVTSSVELVAQEPKELFVSTAAKEGSSVHSSDIKKTVQNKKQQVFVEKTIPKKEEYAQNTTSVAAEPLVLESITVGDFALKTGKPVSEVIVTLLRLGFVCAKNYALSTDQVTLLAQTYGIPTVKPTLVKHKDSSASLRVAGSGKERLPIVVVMGHVDHGKTTLLDYIRKTRVVAREKGGITQHLGAYEAQTPQGNIVFLDTPGHAAFSKVRYRGAYIADLAILVVAADDGIMPQTVECIKTLKALEIPIIVAMNKVDKVDKTKLEVVKRQLSQYELLPEEWGGSVICVPISAKEGTGVDNLLEMVILQSHMMELQGALDQPGQGYILESKVEKGRGFTATVICRHGTIAVGNYFSAGSTHGKIVALKDSYGALQQKIGPSVPVVVAGFDELPEVGSLFQVITDKEYKALKSADSSAHATHRPLASHGSSNQKVTNLIIKAEGNASLEALVDGIDKVSKEVKHVFSVIHTGIGNIMESDVILAETTGAIIIGFGIKADHAALLYAKKSGSSIKTFDIIYRIFEFLEDFAKKNEEVKKVVTKIGEATVLKVFDIKKFGIVAGSYIRDGRFSDKGTVTIWRGKKVVGQGKIKSLQRDKKSVKEVHTGFECAFMVDGFVDWQQDDRVECFLEI